MAPKTSHRRSPGLEIGPARGVNEVRTGPRRNPLVGPVGTGKGVPGDGDALLIIQRKPIHYNNLLIVTDMARRQPGRDASQEQRLQPLSGSFAYLVIVPQAIRSPAAPAGSVFISSAFA